MAHHPEGPRSRAIQRRWFLRRADLEARANATRAEIRAQVKATRAQIDEANIKIQAKTGRNLPLAILIGLALGVAMLLSLLVVKSLFMIVAAILVGFTAYELASALRYAGRDVPRWASVIAALATIPAAFYLGDQGKWLVTLGGILFVALWRTAELIRPSHRAGAGAVWADIAAGTFVQVYVPFLASFAVLLAAKPSGEWWTMAFLIVVVAVDTGAYATGMSFGKHKMAPRISPKKTWEGFIGSAAAGLIAGSLLAVYMLQQPLWFGLVFGATMVFTATVGDLMESLIKRDLGIKDISTWLPGHGGFLDRMDSILPSALAAYILFLIFA
ncbi:MAG TPA: phosphatidate cytidylyltransferase [Microbacteriaceae bacterium]|jgi:CDP-diglyceride synthetase